MRVYGVQIDIVWEDKAANHAKVRALLERANPQSRSLIVLPEMFSTGFSMNVAEIAEGEARETETFLSAIAAAYGVYLLGGVVTAGADGRGRNEAVLYGIDGGEIMRYSKIHPFSYGTETEHYGAGDQVLLARLPGMTLAPFVCYDLRFPEVFRIGARGGAQLYAVIANWPKPRQAHWLALLKARAIENQAYVIGVNRCGRDPKLAYSGRSQILNPHGEVMADAGEDEGVITVDLNLDALTTYRQEFPALADLHPEYVGDGYRIIGADGSPQRDALQAYEAEPNVS